MKLLLFLFAIFLVSKATQRRNIFQLVEDGDIDENEVFLTEEFVDRVKKEVMENGLKWTPTYHESKFKGMSVGEVLKTVTRPEIVELEENRIRRIAKIENSTFWNGKKEVQRRSLPTEYIFYYPSKTGSYDVCYDTVNNPIRNQGSCGSCYAFAAVQLFDDRYCKATVDKGYRAIHIGSVQSLMSCYYNTEGEQLFTCNGGSTSSVLRQMQKSENGAMEDSCLDYIGKSSTVLHCPSADSVCPDDSTKKTSDKLYCQEDSIVSLYSYKFSQAMQAIIDHGAVGSSFKTYDDFYSYKSGIYQRTPSAEYLGGHAIVVMGWGYESGTPVWYCKNSWGSNFGEDGFFKVERSLNDGQDIDTNGIQFGNYWRWCLPVTSDYVCYDIASDMSYVCNGHGTCIGNDQCSCDNGWSGNNCEMETPLTCSPSCNVANGGVCKDGTPDYCVCSTGWDPSDGCNTATCNGIKAGSNGVCNNHGTCVGPNQCSCNSGYYGTYCDKTITCSPSCQNGGICKAKSDNSGTYCDCSSTGYSGTSCETATCTQTCQNGGSCTSPNTCTCINGWSGSDCSDATCSPACVHGTCNIPNKCSCETLWTGDACNTPKCSSDCQNGGSCINPPTCTCINDWFGDDCTQFTCTITCENGGACNGPNRCGCVDGWEGTTCTDFNCNLKPCQNGGTCISPNKCQCITTGDDKFRGDQCQFQYFDNVYCNGILSSNAQVCSSQGSCMETDVCECLSGYKGDLCENAIHCNSIPHYNESVCSGNGICLEKSDELLDLEGFCSCNSGYEGDYCSIKTSSAGTIVGVTLAVICSICIFGVVIAVIAVLLVLGIQYFLKKEHRKSLKANEFAEYNFEKDQSKYESIPKDVKPKLPKQTTFNQRKLPPSVPKKKINNRFAPKPPMQKKFVPKIPVKKKFVPKVPTKKRFAPEIPNKKRFAPKPPTKRAKNIGNSNQFILNKKRYVPKKKSPPVPKKSIPRIPKKKSPPSIPRKRMPPKKPTQKKLRVIQSYKKTRGDELSIKKGEFLTLVRKEGDGWILAKNSSGQEGFVPGNFCK